MANPLKFLDPYLKSDKDSFFGRNVEVKNLYKKVKSNAITLFYGLSGTGKSSVILCGLSNKFDEVDWMPFIVRRTSSQDIITATRRTLDNNLDNNANIFELLDDIYSENFRTIYLIYDQLEELFIYGDKAEEKEFITFLQILRNSVPYVRIILVLREEYLAHLSNFEIELPELRDSKLRLEQMEEAEVKEVIANWGNQLKVEIDDRITSIIVERVRKKAPGYTFPNYTESAVSHIQLPYLQVYFTEILNSLGRKEEGEKMVLLENDLPSLGEVNDVLTDFIELSVRDIAKTAPPETNPEDQEQNVWQVLSALVSYEGTKQAKSLSVIQKEILS